jgi:hypothetical protein
VPPVALLYALPRDRFALLREDAYGAVLRLYGPATLR